MGEYERFRQVIGRFEVLLRGDTVILRDPDQHIERNMTAEEACKLFSWLYAHKAELYKIVRQDEQEMYGEN